MPAMANPVLWVAWGAFLFVTVLQLKTFMSRRRSRLPLPPGPKGLPFFGNSLDIPKEFEWITYHKWCKEFQTDILYLDLAGTPLIVLDSFEVVNQLLEKRSSVFSNRPQYTMQNELIKLEFNTGFMDYGKYSHWQKHRRLMHEHFNAGASRLLRPQSMKAARNLLIRFLEMPDDPMGNLRQMAGETIMAIAYGLQVQPHDDPYIKTAREAVHSLVGAGAPGKYLVDAFPNLKYVPEWVPGAGFQKTARECRELAREMLEAPYAAAKKNIADGVCPPCFTSRCLEALNNEKDKAYFDEETIQNNAGTMYTAGSDTTVSAIASCILGLLENPHVVKKAQADLDRVLEPGRLPDFDDEASLPYITAIVKEALRWRDVGPIAVPRKLLVEEACNGYRLPAGSIIIPNAWAILHDEKRYPDPFTFNPDRFMTADGRLDESVFDPERACWGFGRRVCQGRYMAYSAIWINIASMLAVFDIKKAIDEEGRVIEPSHEYLSGIICIPKPFKCAITPRSEEAEKLIRACADVEL